MTPITRGARARDAAAQPGYLFRVMPRECPICGNGVGDPRTNRAFPLCSARCRAIDLGRWLSESYRIPAEPVPRDEADSLAPSFAPDEDA